MIHRFPFIALCALTISSAIPPLRAATETKLNYLSSAASDAITLLPAPPEPGSPEDRLDLDNTYNVHVAATLKEIALSKDEDKLSIFHFAPAIGPWFQPGKFPKTEALFQEVEVEAKAVTDTGKKHWQRARPYNADPVRFSHAIEHEGKTSYSYPSGHSTRGTVFALLLAELFPEQREAILAKGREAGWLRVQGGVHYPTDIYAGRVLGQSLARTFLANPAFQQKFAEVKAELATSGSH
jgi:acid phosphatase (class A)